MPSAVIERLARLLRSARSAAKTLRVRLMIWNAGLVLVTALACFLGIREGVRRTLVRELDKVLTSDVSEVRLEVKDLGTTIEELRAPARPRPSSPAGKLLEDLERKAIGHQHNGWFVELLDDQGRRLWSSEQAPTLSDASPMAYDLTGMTQNGFRIVEDRQTTPLGKPLRIRVGAPIDFIDQDIDRIDRLAGMGVGIVLFAAPLAGYWLAGRTIRPLAAIIRTTARLRPNRMDERLSIRQTDDELDRLSATVNQFLDRIAAYLTQSNDLLANSAHELRTPLAAIRSSVEVALAGKRTPQEYQELLSEVIDECASLERLVNQLLLLSETDTERLRTRSEKLVLSGLVSRCVEMFSAVAESRQIELDSEIEQDVEFVGFAHHLRQVVNNLLDNAIKFSKPGGTVHVKVCRDLDGAAVLRVQDTGRGIPQADLPHVFERFFRGDKSRQRFEETTGTGLGLSICQAIVAAHGGQIIVESCEGVGTTMTVRFPPTHDANAPGAIPETRDASEAVTVVMTSTTHSATSEFNSGAS